MFTNTLFSSKHNNFSFVISLLEVLGHPVIDVLQQLTESIGL